MHFVGRREEAARVIEELDLGNNLILSGKHGIGRTALLKHVAEIESRRRRLVFTDFSKSSGEVCRAIFAELFAREKARHSGDYQPYKWARYRIATMKLQERRPLVLVFDNIANLSHQKLDLIHYLEFQKRFRFVAIVENFLHPDELFLLRAALIPVSTIQLGYLDKSSVEQFFSHYSEQYGWDWTEEEIATLVKSVAGYPLRMQEMVARRIRRQKDQRRARAQWA